MCGCGTTERAGLTASDAAVMCLVCVRRHGEACVVAPEARSVPITVRATEGSCPRGHHDAAPRWLGVRWVGVPRPIRWALGINGVRRWLGLPPRKHWAADAYISRWRQGKERGCGCVVPLKAAWTRLSGSAWARRAACWGVVAVVTMLAVIA